MNCDHCGGFVIVTFVDDSCVNCGRSPARHADRVISEATIESDSKKRRRRFPTHAGAYL